MRNLYVLWALLVSSCAVPCESPRSVILQMNSVSPLLADYQQLLYLYTAFSRNDTGESLTEIQPLEWNGKGGWELQNGFARIEVFEYYNCHEWLDGSFYPYEVRFSLQYEDGQPPKTGPYPPQLFTRPPNNERWQAELWDGFVLSMDLW